MSNVVAAIAPGCKFSYATKHLSCRLSRGSGTFLSMQAVCDQMTFFTLNLHVAGIFLLVLLLLKSKASI